MDVGMMKCGVFIFFLNKDIVFWSTVFRMWQRPSHHDEVGLSQSSLSLLLTFYFLLLF